METDSKNTSSNNIIISGVYVSEVDTHFRTNPKNKAYKLIMGSMTKLHVSPP